MTDYEWNVEPSDFSYGKLLPLFKLYWFLFKPKGYRRAIRHRLSISGGYLWYQKDGATIWQIECSRLAHLEIPRTFSGTSAFDNSYPARIRTSDDDAYVFESTLPANVLEKLKAEIGEAGTFAKQVNHIAAQHHAE